MCELLRRVGRLVALPGDRVNRDAMAVNRLAEVVDRMSQRQLLTRQQLDRQPKRKQHLTTGSHGCSLVEQPAQVPRTSNSTSPRRKPRGSFGGGGGSALRQKTPPQPVQRKWM